MRLAIVLSSMLLAALPQARQSTAGASLSIYRVQLDTSKGAILVEVHRDWAPHGADRFHELVAARYYDDNRFFRVVAGRWAQFGINGDPAVSSAWRARTIPDDPMRQWGARISKRRGPCIAAVAVARRLAGVLWAMCRDGTFYSPADQAQASSAGIRRRVHDDTAHAAALERAARKLRQPHNRRRTTTSEAAST